MCRSSRRSWPVLLLLTVLAVSIAAGPLFAQPQKAAPAPHAGVAEPHDTADLYNSLRDVINYGAELFNKQADHAGCYRVYQGALISIRPFLTPETRKGIDESIVRAEALPYPAERAFELRKTLDAIRAKSAPNRAPLPAVATAPTDNSGTKVAVPRVGKIIIVGNTVTKDDVIRRAIGIYPGQPLSFPDLRVAEKNLAQLGIFEVNPDKGVKPTITAVAIADANVQDIIVTVKEMEIGGVPKIDPPKVAIPNLDLPKITDAPKVTPPKVEVPKVESPNIELPKVSPPTVDLPKVDLPKVDLPKNEDKKKPEVPKVDPPKVDVPKVDLPNLDLPRVESPRIDLPKIDDKKKPEAPKVDLPKVDLPKIEDRKPEAPKVVDPLKIDPPGIDLPKPEAPKAGDPLKIELPGVAPPKAAGTKGDLPIDPLRLEPPNLELPGIAKKDGKAELCALSGTLIANDGKPLPPGFKVTMVSALGKRFSTTVQKEGSYSFTPGIPAGKYRMAIEPAAGEAGKQNIVPARYTDDTTSGLTFDVQNSSMRADAKLVK